MQESSVNGLIITLLCNEEAHWLQENKIILVSSGLQKIFFAFL